MTRSFSARLRVYVVGFTAVLFVMACYVIFRFSYSFIREEAVHRADALLDNTILRIDGVLGSVETAVNNSAWAVGDELDRPDSLYAGVPARKIREVTPEQREQIIKRTAHDYRMYASWYEE